MKNVKALLTSKLFCLVHAYAQASEINLITADYSPFYGPNLPNEGPITEIVTEAFNKAGYQVSVKYVSWARAMADAKAGKADGLHGAWYSKEREQWFAYSDKLPGNEIVLFKRKGSEAQSFTGYGDLRSYKIGIVREYRNPPEFDAAKLRTEVANSDGEEGTLPLPIDPLGFGREKCGIRPSFSQRSIRGETGPISHRLRKGNPTH
jgi:polar amino acid transport system substrate-binding protein